jgi:hypothetical protein
MQRSCSTDSTSSSLFGWETYREHESREIQSAVDGILTAEEQSAHAFDAALRSLQVQLAGAIEQQCSGQMHFATGMMIQRGESTPHDCARRVLELVELFHILCGSSWNDGLFQDRKGELERLGMEDIDGWVAIARGMTERVFRNIMETSDECNS